jgi:hypothetical protein
VARVSHVALQQTTTAGHLGLLPMKSLFPPLEVSFWIQERGQGGRYFDSVALPDGTTAPAAKARFQAWLEISPQKAARLILRRDEVITTERDDGEDRECQEWRDDLERVPSINGWDNA